MGHGELRWTGTQTAGANARAASYTSAADRAPEPLADRVPERAARGSGDRVHGAIAADERAAFLDLVLGADDAAPARFVDQMLARGVDVATIYLDLLGPTAVALGDMWVEDTCDFFDVTIGVGRLQRAVRDLGQGFVTRGADAPPAGRVLLASLPGDQHTLGMFMVAEFLLRDGWGVRVGTPGTADDLAALLRDEWFDVIGFSAACDVRLLALRHQVAAVRRHSRNPQVRVLVGGRVFVEHPELAARVGADAFATSAEDAPSRARALLASRSS